MKVFNKLSNGGKEVVTSKSELNGGKVLRKLILKAEMRKSYAENFRIYAVLQSTITKLKLDNNSLKVKHVSGKIKLGNGLGEMDSDRKHLQSNSVQNVVPSTNVDDQDPLQLNSFFEELRTR